MSSRTVEVINKRGLHARASAKFVTLASQIDAAIEVEKDGNKVCGTSIMGLMMLGAAMGDTITISATGLGAELAVEQLVALVEARFHEDACESRGPGCPAAPLGPGLRRGAGINAAPGHGLFQPPGQAGAGPARQEE
jgi:phosphocarrier protein HPr